MSFVLPGLRRGLLISTPFLLAAPLVVQTYKSPLRCDGPDPFRKITSDLRKNVGHSETTPSVKQSGLVNPRIVRQISMGSILGVIGGLGVSVFSKPLAILIGLAVVLVQFLETRGIHVIPYSYLQRRMQQTNVRGLIQSNPAFKFTFGITFALAAFAEF
ncbi:hypothetical protein M011DRAFT_396716 [Sporormia fimetaria CBS 119925]|uniref:FUN14-domain-containing protein n=1 Tax=Sporormia fimetaria CBS 119925 TaxID=1340428 RepID=A0A6A6VJD9_9PLEO|nr:hypothetical protein M011DRAFT_396716 [Sporormia fimetaria CBS 119925]